MTAMSAAAGFLPRIGYVLAHLRDQLTPSLAWIHAGRTAAAAMLALYLAYVLQLDSPSSAAVTVVIVSHPVQGMVWAKGLYRALGTLIGAVMAIALGALFAQTPVLFLIAFGLWMALCAALSTLLRNFRSYGAVLAGYTVGLIVFPHFPTSPDALFDLATARVAAVLLGLACSALVGSLTTSRQSAAKAEAALGRCLVRLTAYIRLALDAGALAGTERQRQTLRTDILALDGLMELAAAEGTTQSAVVAAQRGAIPAMLSCLTATASAHDAVTAALTRSADPAPLVRLRAQMIQMRDALAHALDRAPAERGKAVAAIAAQATVIERHMEDGLVSQDIRLLRAFDRLDAVLSDLTVALDGLSASSDRPRRPMPQLSTSLHLEWRWAAINGIRAALTVWMAGAVWVMTAWPSGAMMVGAVIPNVSLLSMRDRPDLDALQFLIGISLAAGAALTFLTLILPALSGFPLLAVALGTVLWWGTLQSLRPSRAFMGLGFLVFFLMLLSPANIMHYDLAAFLNTAQAVIGAAILTAIVHRLILRVHPFDHIRSLLADIRNDVQKLTKATRILAPAEWETLMHDRMVRLNSRLKAGGDKDDSLMHGTHAALRVGREIIRLRGLADHAETAPAAARAIRVVLRAIGERDADRPSRTVRLCRMAARKLTRLAAAGENQRIARAATSLVEIAFLLGRRRRFFWPGTMGQRESSC
jgi:uncharacterized membrane protein YccC